MILDSIRGAKSVNWEENRELGVVRLHIFNSRISNSRKIPGPKKRELGGHTVCRIQTDVFRIINRHIIRHC